MNLCEMLDDYVAHDLVPPERARFEAHLALCPACRQSVEAERCLDSLLAEAATGPVPEGLSERVRWRLVAARRRRVAAGLSLLAACASAFVLAGHWLTVQQPSTPAPEAKAPSIPPAPEAPPATPQIHVTFRDPARVLAVPVPSDSPHVTLIQIYTGLREPEQSQEISNSERNDP
jgi:anti-sigma factor RsiW